MENSGNPVLLPPRKGFLNGFTVFEAFFEYLEKYGSESFQACLGRGIAFLERSKFF
jgi:hypothetical protein